MQINRCGVIAEHRVAGDKAVADLEFPPPRIRP
jgi:hypothetical protein